MTDEAGNVFPFSTDVSLSPKSVSRIVMECPVPYGIYEAKVDVVKDGRVCAHDATRISVIAPAGKVNPKMGFADHMTKVDTGTNIGKNATLKMAKLAGASTIRDELRWTSFVKAENSSFEADSYLKNWLNTMESEGMKKYGILGYTNPAVIDEEFPVQTLDKFAQYAKQAAEYTKDMNIDYEIWNEYNYSINKLYKTTVEDYVNMAKAVYPVVKGANPDADIYVMSVLNNPKADVLMNDFVEQALELGIGDYCDGISYHPYHRSAPDTETSLAEVDGVLELMKKYGVEDKKVVFSEYGWTSCGQADESTTLTYAIDESTQANYTVQAAALNQDKVDKILWYNLTEKSKEGMSNSEQHFGFIRGWAYTDITYEAKPVFLAFSNFNRLMTGSERIRQIECGENNEQLHLFNTENGGNIIIGWSNNGDKEIAIETGVDTVILCDRYGNEEVKATDEGVLNITLTESPVYIIADDLSGAKCKN